MSLSKLRRASTPDETRTEVVGPAATDATREAADPDAIPPPPRRKRPVASESEIDEALRMTFPASDPMAL